MRAIPKQMVDALDERAGPAVAGGPGRQAGGRDPRRGVPAPGGRLSRRRDRGRRTLATGRPTNYAGPMTSPSPERPEAAGHRCGSATVELAVTGMHCGSCSALIEESLAEQPGVIGGVGRPRLGPGHGRLRPVAASIPTGCAADRRRSRLLGHTGRLGRAGADAHRAHGGHRLPSSRTSPRWPPPSSSWAACTAAPAPPGSSGPWAGSRPWPAPRSTWPPPAPSSPTTRAR